MNIYYIKLIARAINIRNIRDVQYSLFRIFLIFTTLIGPQRILHINHTLLRNFKIKNVYFQNILITLAKIYIFFILIFFFFFFFAGSYRGENRAIKFENFTSQTIASYSRWTLPNVERACMSLLSYIHTFCHPARQCYISQRDINRLQMVAAIQFWMESLIQMTEAQLIKETHISAIKITSKS